MAAYDAEGKLIEGTEGRVIKLEHKFSYWGDGDGTYYWQAVVATDEGYETIQVGESCWNGYGHTQADAKGSAVDAPQSVIDHYPVWQEEQAEKFRRERYAEVRQWSKDSAYYLTKGALALVEKGTRKRKHEGAWGHIIWIGTDRFGNERCGIKNPDTEEVVWVNTNQVAIIPDYDDFEPLAVAQAAD